MPDVPERIRAIELTSTCVVDAEGRQNNLASAVERGLPLVQKLPERTGRLAIVASGPSVRDHLDELRTWPGEIWAINGAYDYLLDNDIVPHGFFALDPLPELAEYLKCANHETIFYMSATSDPSTFDALQDHKVQLFFAANEDNQYPDGWVIGGGTTSLTRAPYLGLLQGWRDITLFGADSSYDGGEYCYEWGRYSTDIRQPHIPVVINGEGPFITEIGLLKQVSQMGVLHRRFNGMLKIRCGGLMDAFLRSPIVDDSNIEVEKDDAA